MINLEIVIYSIGVLLALCIIIGYPLYLIGKKKRQALDRFLADKAHWDEIDRKAKAQKKRYSGSKRYQKAPTETIKK